MPIKYYLYAERFFDKSAIFLKGERFEVVDEDHTHKDLAEKLCYQLYSNKEAAIRYMEKWNDTNSGKYISDLVLKEVEV